MYSGYLDTLDSYAKDIYEISKEYKVHGLTNLARDFLIKDLNIQNCCEYLVFCVVQNDYELNSKIQAFISENFETIVKTNAYKHAKRKYRELFENTFGELAKIKYPNLNTTTNGFNNTNNNSGLNVVSGLTSNAAAVYNNNCGLTTVAGVKVLNNNNNSGGGGGGGGAGGSSSSSSNC
jgi:hypothetical protein